MRHKGNIMERRILLKTINNYIICTLCKGYLIDATTITECLHTFCKSCLVKYLKYEGNVNCPKCGILIHQSHPLNYISHDRTIQDIVYKLVPKLQDCEMRIYIDFCRARGIPLQRSLSTPEDSSGGGSNSNTLSLSNNGNSCSSSSYGGSGSAPSTPGSTPTPTQPNFQHNATDKNMDFHKTDEQVNVCLESKNTSLKALRYPFLRLSSHATITHIKKFISYKLYHTMEKYREVDILCNNEILGKDHTLKFICVTRWRTKDIPLPLQYRPHVDL